MCGKCTIHCMNTHVNETTNYAVVHHTYIPPPVQQLSRRDWTEDHWWSGLCPPVEPAALLWTYEEEREFYVTSISLQTFVFPPISLQTVVFSPYLAPNLCLFVSIYILLLLLSSFPSLHLSLTPSFPQISLPHSLLPPLPPALSKRFI